MTTQQVATILIVDDEPINLAILTETLKARYEIRTASSGSIALERALHDPPDLVLLDVVMPDMDGYEVLRQWKANARTRDVPVIFVTGQGAASDQIHGLSAGAVDYITKPFEMPIVVARVETHLALKRKSDLLNYLVSIDPLTEIGNRRRFDDYLRLEWRRCQRNQQSLSIAMIDIDGFKKFNDTYGHAAGDECLRRVARQLAGAVRRGEDCVARYGGEEFGCVLPGTNLDGGIVVAETLRSGVDALAIPHRTSDVADHVTVSVGVASAVADGEPVERLVDAADRELYEAKRRGRNRVSPQLPVRSSEPSTDASA